jgi:tetratricopeptide (TPR) repeat protein
VKQRGTLVCSLAVWCLLLLSGVFSVGYSATAESDGQPEFEKARRDYLARKVQQFNLELIRLEKHLVWELHSLRHALTLPGAATVMPAAEVESILQSELQSPNSSVPDSSLGPISQVDGWIQLQREDLVYRLMLADGIRSRLLTGLDETGLASQFRFDLGAAVEAYARGDFDLAARLLHTIRQTYPYQNVDDLLFFEGEACLAINLYDRAGDIYRQLLRQYPDSPFRIDALRHLLYVETYYGHFQRAQTEYAEFRSDQADGDPEIAYIMGIVSFQLNNVPRSREFLASIPAGSSYTYRARHLEGVCRILEGRYDEAIAVFEGLLGIPPRELGPDQANTMHEDARIKLGHLYFEKGDFEKAAGMFASIRLGSEWYDDALIGQAWSDLSLSDYVNAAARARELAEHAPDSEYIYEARTLAGYASEQLEQQEESAADYSLVLDHAERSEQLRTLMAEQGEIRIQIRRLAALEERVFLNGEGAAWNEYHQVRDQLRQVFRRIKYTELATANAEMGEYIEERRLILDLRDGLSRFSGPQSEWDAATTNEYMELRERVTGLMGKVRVAGLVQIRRNPVVLKENELQMTKAVTDSLLFSSSIELDKLSERHVELESSTPGSLTAASRFQRSVLAERYGDLEQRLDRWRVDTEARRAAPFNTDLPHWSNLAFSRLVLGDIRFDDLEKLDERIKELEGYIERIDSILEGDRPAPTATPTAGGTTVPAAGPAGEVSE